jgi:ATP-binding cassette, subfamily C (CFTR/MRP), member 4
MAKKHKITMIMIAHRLETAVAYSDKIMVMDNGSVAEFDTAFQLLCYTPEDTSVTSVGIFASMVRTLPHQQ